MNVDFSICAKLFEREEYNENANKEINEKIGTNGIKKGNSL